MRDMSNKVGDIDQIKAERYARNNPPNYEVGQSSDEDWENLFEDSQSSTDSSSFGGSSYSSLGGSSFDSSSFNALGGSIQGQGVQNTVNTDIEDKCIETVAKVSKSSFFFMKDIVFGLKDGLSQSDCFDISQYSGKVLISSGAVTGVSFILWCFSIFSDRLTDFKWVTLGGLISLSLGFVLFGFSLNASRKARERYEREGFPDTEDDSDNSLFETSQDDIDVYDEQENQEDEGGWGSFGDEDGSIEEEADLDFNESIWDFSSSNDSSNDEEVIEEPVDIDDAISSIRDIPPHTQTRQYLFEEYSRVLPKMNPNFAKLEPISEEDPNFLSFDQILRDASIQVGTKEDKIPVLKELRENQFIIQLKATRPSGLKEEDIASEIANIYSKDDFGALECEGVYATTSSVGGNFIINIFKGENSLVSLADTYTEVKDFILNTKNSKPIVFGVNELGRVWTFDADKIFSYIISGKPRSGKSWAVVSLILQLCMYSSPKEVIFEAFDVKGTSSDYYMMNKHLPHFKKFESDGSKILQRLRYLTTTEANRRKKILNDVGVKNNLSIINIADLKKESLDVEMPYLYVVIDEIVGLIGTFSKEEHAEFKDLVNVLITQMPNLGIKLILVPHRVTNDIVPKTTYTNVGCIACVRSDVKEINNTLDITKKDFPYDLANTGDMALKSGEINKGKVVFSHGIAITKSNDTNVDIYKFVGSLWNKLEPEECNSKEDKGTYKESYKGHTLMGIDDVEEDSEVDDFWDFL